MSLLVATLVGALIAAAGVAVGAVIGYDTGRRHERAAGEWQTLEQRAADRLAVSQRVAQLQGVTVAAIFGLPRVGRA